MLACLGGEPVKKSPWPQWPSADSSMIQALIEVANSGRWAISGCFNGKKSFERKFSEAFSAYHGARYCVPTTNGSSALSIALEALGVGPGNEVLVPALTWVACASSVANLGARPVFIDISPDTLCMDPQKTSEAISRQTAAILLVHAYCRVADLDAFTHIADKTGVPLLEDCSQAHGALWRGRRVGTFGKIAAFSMQQSKVLTSGEGGAAITDDDMLYDLMQQLRADGRRYVKGRMQSGEMELEEVGHVMGSNRCLSEFQAAVLLTRLANLDVENDIREGNALLLERMLTSVEAVEPLHRPWQMDRATHYQPCLRLNRDAFGGRSIEAVCRALSCELGIYTEPVDTPLNANKLYNPKVSRRFSATKELCERYDLSAFSLPEAWKARQNCLCLPNQVLLGSKEDMHDIVAALEKLKTHAADIPELIRL